MALHDSTQKITGRCYCGAVTFRATEPPQSVAYCHCVDCRRATGGPVAAFAAFAEHTVLFEPDEGRAIEANPGVTRTFCAQCGSSLTGRYDYLQGQIYISVGVIDQADLLVPSVHSHAADRLPWLHIRDDAEKMEGSAKAVITQPPA